MTDNQTIKDRLLIYINYSGLKNASFEQLCGLSNGYINNSKGNFGAKKLEDILSNCPDLNRTWLLTGEGEMLNSQPSTTITIGTNTGIAANINSGNVYHGVTAAPATETEDIPEAEVAVIPTELYKDPNTNLYQYTEVNDVETQPIVHQFSPHDRFYRVINSSMSPKLLASDVVALQRVDINDSIPGCVYMIDHRTKGSFLRKVTDQGDVLLLTSYNKEDYPDFIVYKKDVLNLARVVGLIRTDI